MTWRYVIERWVQRKTDQKLIFKFNGNFFFFLFMSDAHHGINSSTQKYQSTPSSVVLTSCRQDSGSPPF